MKYIPIMLCCKNQHCIDRLRRYMNESGSKFNWHLKQNSETTSKDTATSEIDYCFLRRWYPYHAIEGKILHVSVSNRSLIMEMLNFLGLN